ncbi:MAG: CHAT domain-containing protein, partial [Microcystis aeruginosa]
FYDSFRPQESAIALSDGLLTVRDINKLNLSSYRLVCLAACETALTGKDGITTEYVGTSVLSWQPVRLMWSVPSGR